MGKPTFTLPFSGLETVSVQQGGFAVNMTAAEFLGLTRTPGPNGVSALLATNSAAGISQRFRSVPRVGFLGDSLSAFGILNKDWSNTGYVPWLKRLLRNRLQTSTALDFGVSGVRTDHFLATQVPAAIVAAIDIAFVQIGTNDVANFTLAQSIANIDAGVAQLNAAGIAVVLISVAPQTAWGAPARQQAYAFNAHLRDLANDRTRNARFIDINPTFVDYSTGNAIAGYLHSDGVHDSPVGGLTGKATRIYAGVDDLFPKYVELLPISAVAQYNATLAPGGSLLTNGLFADTGVAGLKAASPTGLSGTVGSNWNLAYNNSGGTTTFTVVASKGTDANNATIPTQILTLGGVGDAFYMRLRAQSVPGTNGVTIPAGVVAGDQLVFEADMSWTGVTGVSDLMLRLEITDGTTTTFVRDGCHVTPGGTTTLSVPGTFSGGLFVTDPLIVPPNATTLNATVEIIPISGAAVAGVVTVSRANIRKVN